MSNIIAMDIETHGNYLFDKDARILCCGAFGNGLSTVFNFDNPVDRESCRQLLADKSIDKVFHNCLYDTSWLYCKYNFEINGIIHDTMTRASLIDEYQPLNLDACCKRLGITGKNKAETIEAWFTNWQNIMKGCAKGLKKGLVVNNQVLNVNDGETYKLSPEEMTALVNETYKGSVWDNALILWQQSKDFKDKMMTYNLQDCKATYELFNAQERLMTNLQKVYAMECKLIPIVLKMKKVGIRFDAQHAKKLISEVEEKRSSVENKLIDMYGISGDIIRSTRQLGTRLNEMGIHSPIITKTGKESWGVDAVIRIHHPVIALIEEYKNYDAILGKFLQGSLSANVVNGRIHCTFLPMLRDEGGTVTGRFSCRDPNLQQIPARNKGHGIDFSQDMRSLFLPEEGQMLAAMDYSQIEALLLAHFAHGPQAAWFTERMRAGEDLHNIVMNMTGIKNRMVVKCFNYGCIYGMGWKTAMIKNYTVFNELAEKEHIDTETYTKNLYNTFHKKFPVIRDTMKWIEDIAKAQGYIDTMGGRILHKPKAQYDPATGKINDFIYKMLNKLIQGTAADILKQALISAWDAGIYNVLTLHLLVHDEQVNSVPFNKEGTEALTELQRIACSVYKDELALPIKASIELGPNWGYWSGDIYAEMQKGNFDKTFFNKNYKDTH